MTHLDALNPHDEPADVAGHLGDDGEPHHEVVMGGDEQDGQHQRQSGEHHAHAVNPPPPETIFNVCKMIMMEFYHEPIRNCPMNTEGSSVSESRLKFVKMFPARFSAFKDPAM